MKIKPQKVFVYCGEVLRALPVLLPEGRSVHACAGCHGEYDDAVCQDLPACESPSMIFKPVGPALAD